MSNVGDLNDLSHLKSLFSQYKTENSNSGGGKKKGGEIIKKYFSPKNDVETFRILPTKEKKFWTEAYFHIIPLNESGGVIKGGKAVYCPKHNDPPQKTVNEKGETVVLSSKCALCEKAERILSKQNKDIVKKVINKEALTDGEKIIKAQNDEIYKEGSKWEAKKHYIIKGIDRGVEKEGVKFWRFKHHGKKQGVLDKLIPVLNIFVDTKKANFMSPVNGCDLTILQSEADWNGRAYMQVSNIICKDQSPLHQDPVVSDMWLNDPITWRDVFTPKKAPGITTQEFLELAADGRSPYWDESDSKNKRWVFPGRPDLEAKAKEVMESNFIANSSSRQKFASDVDLDDSDYYENSFNEAPSISNTTSQNVGTYVDNSTTIMSEEKRVVETIPANQSTIDNDYADMMIDDNLPF